MATPFVSFDAKSLANGQRFVHNINGNSNSLEEDKIFFPNLYKSIHNLYVLMDFYLVFSMEVCPRSSQLNG
jgi:hypothetical protein